MGAVYCKKMALAAVPSARAETKVAFIRAKQPAMPSIKGRKERSPRRNVGKKIRPAKSTR